MKLGGKPVIIAAAVAFLMLTEGAVLYLMLAPAPPTAEAAQSKDDAKPEMAEATGPKEDAKEVLIDSFNCTNSKVAPGAVVHVSFKLSAIVSPASQFQAFDDAANKDYKTRVRQQVERIVRSSTMDELHDPNLSTIRRTVKEDINKLLEKGYITDVTMSDFRLIEQ